MGEPSVRIGLEVCLCDPPRLVQHGRWGLLMNQASVDGTFRYACDALAERWPGRLAAIFSPQHGLWGEEQANMLESPHGFHQRLGVPIYSLYCESRRPTCEMLEPLDCLLVDLQDVGTRVYTFAWTLSHCLEACAEVGIPLVVLDRPNPLGGRIAEGPLLQQEFASFVGRHSLPMRHGLTLGELAGLLNEEMGIGAELHVVAMQGWRREMLFPDTGRAWTVPSPNMPCFSTALFYPGQVLWEGTNVSEGRGTTLPFEVTGAPFVNEDRLLQTLQDLSPPGVYLRTTRFRPTFDKWRGEICRGVALHVRDMRQVRSYWLTLATLAAIRAMAPDRFAWLPPPYEYETRLMPIDIITGSDAVRLAIDRGVSSAEELAELAALDAQAWEDRARMYWLYR